MCVVQVCGVEDDHSGDREGSREDDGHAVLNSDASARNDGSQAAVRNCFAET